MNIVKSENKGTGEGGSQHVGVGKFSIVAICPNLKELSLLLNTEKITEEPTYESETSDKDTKIAVTLWLENETVGKKRHTVYVVDKVKTYENKDKETVTVYLNQFGETRGAVKEKDLPETFTHLQTWSKEEKKFVLATDDKGKTIPIQYRKCMVGEDELMKILKNYINGNYWDAECNILLDTKKLFKGKFDELKGLVGSEEVQEIVCAWYVARVEKDGEVKYYQNMSNDTAPLRLWPKINVCLQNGSWDASKDTAYIKSKWVGEKYSIVSRDANAFILGPLQVFDPAKHINMGSSTIQHSDDDKEQIVSSLDY